jgi:hypothetical protein
VPEYKKLRQENIKKNFTIAVESSLEEWQSEEDRSDTVKEDSEEDNEVGNEEDEEIAALGAACRKECAL